MGAISRRYLEFIGSVYRDLTSSMRMSALRKATHTTSHNASDQKSEINVPGDRAAG